MLKGTYAHAYNSAYISHYDEGTMSCSLLWNVIFGNINYDCPCVLKKNGVSGFPPLQGT